MKRIVAFVLVGLLMLVAPAALATPEAPGEVTTQAEDERSSGLRLYEAKLTPQQVSELRSAGIDVSEQLADEPRSRVEDGRVAVDLILNQRQVDELRARGLGVERKRNAQGQTLEQVVAQQAEDGFEVWRSYSEPGGIADELRQTAADHPALTKLVTIGQTIQGQDILAMKVTAGADRVGDGRRPSVLYSAAQHAREWITPEMNTRLMHYYLDNYRADREITNILNTTELWFVPVANPDGYDYTFTEGNRLWRKNLRDNNGDGQITGIDGVDLNRNYPYKWGYDNEGSSPNPGSQVYRGTAPRSEPETRALDDLMDRINFDFIVNYHSAAELLLYGVGWQVATPTPDDNIHIALAGTDENPAIPDYDPDISAELYITNGETVNHAQAVHEILGFTPEMATCQTASDRDPDDEFEAEDCVSGFNFPDSEELVQEEFENNIPFALSVAKSASDPANPVSAVGLEAPDFVVDSFEVSYGDPQTVAVETKREFRRVTMHYSINGGRAETVRPQEWDGGERYGDVNDIYYAEYRGEVSGAEPGDSVEVWFEAREVPSRGERGRARDLESEHFTYTLASDSGADALVIANEDYDDEGLSAPKYVDVYGAALDAAGVSYDIWDVTAQGVPHDLGVLGHYDAVVWEKGDNVLTQDPEDVITETPFGPLPDLSVAERQQYLTISVRDYLNQGGKSFHTGEWVAYFGFFADALGGIYYGLDGQPEQDCVVTEDFFSDCLLLSDDFSQYYEGVYDRASFGAPETVIGVDDPLESLTLDVDGEEVSESGVFQATSDVLPPDEFPQFLSWTSSQYDSDEPFGNEPFSGDYYVAALHADESYMRLSQTVDLTSASTADLSFKLSYNTETGYDHVIVEARPVGTEDWTTLPDAATADGGTSTQVPTQCEDAFFIELHPQLEHYLTLGDPCQNTGTTGAWNSFTGDSGGWTDVTVDLSGYAGQQVEVVITYVTDPATGGVGAFVDDTAVTVDGNVVRSNDFETDLGAWTVTGPPPGSPENEGNWERTTALFPPPGASVTTEDTVTFAYGFEAIATAEQRATVMQRVMEYLLP